jgi:hypothetical protein
VDIQRQGIVGVVLNNEMAEKLALEDDQIQSLREIQGQRRELQKAAGKSQRDVFQLLRTRMQEQDEGEANDNGNGGNGGNAGNGGNRGGRGNRPSPEAMKKFMEDPEVKSAMDKSKKEQDQIDNQTTLAVSKILDKRQRSLLSGMVGPKFDLSTMGGPGGWGGPRGGQAATKKGAVPAGTRPQGTAPAAKPADSTPKRKSLQDLRGTPDDNPN